MTGSKPIPSMKGTAMFILTMFLLSSLSGLIILTDAAEGTDSRGDIMGEWEQLPTGDWPSTITPSYCNIMYREAQNELVVFNRENNAEFEVWSFFENNETWFKWTTSGPEPTPWRSNQAFTSSSDNSVAYYYGGYSQSGGYGDKLNIFFYSNKTWIEIDTPSTLGGRYWSEMIYDEGTDSIWIFGGVMGWNRMDDLHQYNLTDGWNHPDPAIKPPTRDQPLFTITPDGKTLYVALGRYQRQPSRYRTDLWSYDVASNTWTELNSDLGIPTLAGAAFQYRPISDTLLLSLGFSSSGEINNTYSISATDGSVTRIYIDPMITARHVQACDLSQDWNTIYLFGSDDDLKDIVSFNVNSLFGTKLPGNTAWAGGSAFTGYDAEDGGKLMTLKRVSGSYWQLAYFSLATHTWNIMDIDNTGAPSRSDGMAFAYDHVNNDFYLYGGVWIRNMGQGNYQWYYYDDFYKLDCDSGEWTTITENSLPGERGRASLAFDEERGHLYLFGGMVPFGDTNSLWQYNISSNAWKSYSFTQQPNPRREHAVEFDQEQDRMFIFGGRRNGTSTAEYDDLWTFDVINERWQKMAEGEDKPTIQNYARISYNTHTRELLLMGDTDEELYLWRESNSWLGWIPQESETRPVEWSGHGQVYSPETRRHYAWAHDGTQVWEYNPILRTTAMLINLRDPKGTLLNAIPPNINKAFPSSGIYKAEITGASDMPQNDLLGFHVNISGDQLFVNTTWMVSGGVTNVAGNESFIDVLENFTLEWPEVDEWKLSVPFEVLFSGPNGGAFDLRVYPITNEGLSERSQRENLFRILSDLKVAGYQFSSPLQESVSDGDWLYGRTDLTVSGFSVTFADDVSVSPDSGNLRVNMITSAGDASYWDYVPGEDGSITVPVNGVDREMLHIWLNLTDLEGTLINSQLFSFKLDIDPPTAPSWIKIRADSRLDKNTGMDDDNEVFLTWGRVFENGSGYKGMCYSIDHNDWPEVVNLSTEFPDPFNLEEGIHIVYIWAIDNTSRAGPVINSTIIIDTHMVIINEMIPDPNLQFNITQPNFTFRVNIIDELSGVDLESIQYQQSQPDRTLSDWMDLDITAEDLNNVTFSLTLDLVPGIKNIFGIRARDLAGNPLKESLKYGVVYDPGLSTPQAGGMGPEDGRSTTGMIELSWEGNYINPLNLTYELNVEDPLGTVHVFDLSAMKYQFTPSYPGIYTWWVVSKADGLTNQTAKRTFIFSTDDLLASLKNQPTATVGNDAAVEISITNPLDIELNFTIGLLNDNGFTFKGDSEYNLSGGREETIIVALGTVGKEAGTFNLKLNISDEYGRFIFLDIQVKLEPEGKADTDNGDKDDGPNFALFIGLGVLLLIIIIVIVFILSRKKKEDYIEETDEVEEEAEPSLDYDPTGVVADGGTGAQVNVPMAPGVLENEEELRKSGSNVMEITIPSKEEPKIKDSEIPELSEDEYELLEE